ELGVISAGGMAIALVTSVTLLPALLVLVGPDRAPAAASVTNDRPGRAINRPRIVLPLALLLAMLAALALPKVGFDFDPLHLKDPDSESVRTFEILADDPETSPYTIDVVAEAGEAAALAERLRALPEVGSVLTLERFVPDAQAVKLEILDSLAFFLLPVLQPVEPGEASPEAWRVAFGDLLAVVEEEGQAVGAGGDALAGALERFAEDGLEARRLEALERALTGTLPDLIERLSIALEAGEVELADLPAQLVERWQTPDDRRRLLVRPAAPITSNAELEAFADAVLEVEPTATGTPVIVREAGRAVLDAFRTASLIALTTITLVLALVLRDPTDVLLVLIPLVLAVLYTGASAVLLGLELNFANVIVLPLLLGLGVSGAIHVVLRARQAGGGRAVERTTTPRAVLLSALTTIASFGSLAVSDHLGLASMGQLLTIAILWSLVCTLIVLPNLLAVRSLWRARR
ncbi:MAG: MMPL family transporter, partial [Geminicoccaceae bacterium]|nr:MMPL family transporter [Geminicoccaceae bacterium]